MNVPFSFSHFFRFMRDSPRVRLALKSGQRFGAGVMYVNGRDGMSQHLYPGPLGANKKSPGLARNIP